MKELEKDFKIPRATYKRWNREYNKDPSISAIIKTLPLCDCGKKKYCLWKEVCTTK